MNRFFKVLIFLISILALSHFNPHGFIFTVPLLFAHCDTMDGPLITEAKEVFAKGDITPLMKWIKKEDEKELREVFLLAQKASKQGKEAKELAEMYFLENLVRIHRAGEGAPYTGIKPTGSPIDEAVARGDKALETGNVDELASLLSGKVKEEIQKRFSKAVELKKSAGKNVEAGRKYIEAYISYIHFVETIHGLIKESAHGHGEIKHED